MFNRSAVSSEENAMTLKDNRENEFVPRSNRKSYRSKPQRSGEEMFVNAHLLVPGKTEGGGNESPCHVGDFEHCQRANK